MENNNNHIDEFLFLKLGPLEQVPDPNALNTIIFQNEHSHVIDNSIQDHLGEFESHPHTNFFSTIFNALNNHKHPIDFALETQLSNIQESPKYVWNKIEPSLVIQSKKRRRAVALWCLFIASASAISILYSTLLNDKKLTYNKANVSISKVNNSTANTTNKSLEKQIEGNSNSILDATPPTTFNPDIISLNTIKHQSSNKISKNSVSKSTRSITLNSELFSNENENILALQYQNFKLPTILIKSDTVAEKIEKIISQKNYFKKKLSPFFVGGSYGYINEHTTHNSISNQNIHKDAVSVFSDATGTNRNGYSIYIFAGYRIKPNLNVKLGILQSHTSVQSNLNYTFTEVPVFNPDGTIAKYGSRPAAGSPKVNEQNKNTNINTSVPIQLSYKILEQGKLSIWFDAACKIALKNKLNARLFSFLDATMVSDQLIKQQKITPCTGLTFLYQIKPNIHLSAQFQIGYQRKLFYLENYFFKKNELTPALNLGVIYNPLIKQ